MFFEKLFRGGCSFQGCITVKMGRMIVIEGLDGSGKSTQIELLKKYLQGAGCSYRQIKLPDYEDPSSTLVRMYLGGAFGKKPEDVGAFAASAFFAVDRFASFKQHWQADYDGGKLILADRYTTSNAYHQLVKMPRENWDEYLEWLEDFEYVMLGIPRPDFVVYLDMPIEISQQLMSLRSEKTGAQKDVHEADVGYLYRCREAAMYAAQKLGWTVITCAENGEPLSIKTISEKIISSLPQEFIYA